MLFAVASGLVNCTNSYDYEEPDPKMVELAKYAKQHVPEQHPKVRGPLEGFGDVSASLGPGDSRAYTADESSVQMGSFVFMFIDLCCWEGPLPLCSQLSPLC